MRREKENPGLREAQRWMDGAIRAPEGALPEGQLLRSTRRLRGEQRLEIYRGMYRTRMVEALRSDYELLERALGEDAFESLALSYVFACPSTSFTLSHLGNRFPEFVRLATWLPECAEAICRFEQAIARCFDAGAGTPIFVERIDEGFLADLFERRVRPVPSFVGEALAYDVNTHYTRYLADELREGDLPEKKTTHVLFFRQDYQVKRLVVDPLVWALFDGVRREASLGDALDPVLARAVTPQAQQMLMHSLHEWISRSLLQSES